MLIDVSLLVFCIVLGFILFDQHRLVTETRHVKLYLNVLIEAQAKAIDNDEQTRLILENVYALLSEPHHEPDQQRTTAPKAS